MLGTYFRGPAIFDLDPYDLLFDLLSNVNRKNCDIKFFYIILIEQFPITPIHRYTLNYAIIINNKRKIEIMNFLHKYLTLQPQNYVKMIFIIGQFLFNNIIK